ncbi:TSSC4 domain containing protein [Asbolus verrucosus]|uniref:U5 small nuclear ribonucleoprotein TSSC4 n=1 Tax=Asbolus verrucosus TaxID=1661398 RepID=A0A482VK49_ASBVE|nr:TSSC4 domain containing protein [Asbolus verrucosus]
MKKLENSHPFTLKGSNEHFNQRQKNVFDQLNKLQCNLQNNVEEDMDIEETVVAKKSNRSIMKQFRAKESIFKRPQDPISKNYMKTIPDFKKNPHKWKRYSLADVKDEDMSETCNTKAALSFLNELKNRNLKQSESEVSEKAQKMVFKKIDTTVKNGSNNEQKKKPNFKSSKVVMPEYVVGQKITKEKKQKNVKNTSIVQLKLDHLYEEND